MSKASAAQPKLKTIPADFCVSESLFLRCSTQGGARRFTYLRLRKSGFTTFEAVRRIGEHLGIDRDRIGFAGLKDEDGITEQFIGIEGPCSADSIERFNTAHRLGDVFIELMWWGVGDEPVQIGALEGNSFRIVVRAMAPELAERFAVGRSYDFWFLNYFDTQRFGMPDKPKLSHLVGRALIEGDHEQAIRLIARAQTPESAGLDGYAGTAEEYLRTVNGGALAFYQCAWGSHEWNAKLAELVEQVSTAPRRLLDDGLPFTFSRSQGEVLDVLRRSPSAPYARFRYSSEKGTILRDTSTRPCVVQARIRCTAKGMDELHGGASLCEFAFFLLSGCYATMCMRQFLASFEPEPSD
jgi:tRNA pseudouridine13 synthase